MYDFIGFVAGKECPLSAGHKSQVVDFLSRLKPMDFFPTELIQDENGAIVSFACKCYVGFSREGAIHHVKGMGRQLDGSQNCKCPAIQEP